MANATTERTATHAHAQMATLETTVGLTLMSVTATHAKMEENALTWSMGIPAHAKMGILVIDVRRMWTSVCHIRVVTVALATCEAAVSFVNVCWDTLGQCVRQVSNLFVCLFVCCSVGLSVCLFVCLLACLSVFLSVCLSFCLFVCLFVCLSICLSVCLFVCLSVCLSVCLFVCLFVCLSFCLFVGLFVFVC